MAVVEFKGEDMTTKKLDLQDIHVYMQHVETARRMGQVDIAMRLEEMAVDEVGHARELRRI